MEMNYNLTEIIDAHRSLSRIREIKMIRAVNNKEQEQLSKWFF